MELTPEEYAAYLKQWTGKTPEEFKAALDALSTEQIQALLNTTVPIDDQGHTLRLKEVMAQSMIEISRCESAPKETQRDALRLAKSYLNIAEPPIVIELTLEELKDKKGKEDE